MSCRPDQAPAWCSVAKRQLKTEERIVAARVAMVGWVEGPEPVVKQAWVVAVEEVVDEETAVAKSVTKCHK